jgi:hypothetical protein
LETNKNGRSSQGIASAGVFYEASLLEQMLTKPPEPPPKDLRPSLERSGDLAGSGLIPHSARKRRSLTLPSLDDKIDRPLHLSASELSLVVRNPTPDITLPNATQQKEPARTDVAKGGQD